MKLKYNTGRTYDVNGQLIYALYFPDKEKVLMYDASRGIYYKFNDVPHLYNERGMMKKIVELYDANAGSTFLKDKDQKLIDAWVEEAKDLPTVQTKVGFVTW